jgi:CMP-N-acetylneuraminic acid synthetase
MKTIAWVPIKLNNQRLPGKNLALLGGKPLCRYMLETLTQVKGIDEIIVFCSDEAIIQYLPDGVTFIKRDNSLDSFDTRHYDIVDSLVSTVDADIYLNAHVTNPFVKARTIEKGLAKVQSGENDSACTVFPIRNHLWYRGKPFNFTRTELPRTQDLEPLYIDTNLCIYRREVYLHYRSRYGDNPYFMEVDAVEAVDIDYPEDFRLASAIVSTPPPVSFSYGTGAVNG